MTQWITYTIEEYNEKFRGTKFNFSKIRDHQSENIAPMKQISALHNIQHIKIDKNIPYNF